MGFQIPLVHKCLVGTFLGIWLFNSACGFIPSPEPSTPPTCTAPRQDMNPYLSNEIAPDVKGIFEKSLNDLGSARQAALFQLGQNMEHWSAQVDVVNDTLHMVRVTVTYLDPVLIQDVMLNYILNDPAYLANLSTSPMNMTSFEFQLQNTLEQLGARNELLFIVTISSPFYREQAYNSTDLTVNLPIAQMALNSASNTQVMPTHFDRVLSESMDIHQGPVSGIVGYPLALLIRNQCNVVIDQYTNSLTLDIPLITLGGTLYQQKFWSIPIQALVLQSDTLPTPTHDPYAINNPISKLTAPPTPNITPTPATIWQSYWEEMGRYIWDVVINQSHH